MGLLDDAIREHLDLKRRRGGDPVEIERAEREALGPVRRGPEEVEEPPTAPPDDELDRTDEELHPTDEATRFDYEAEPEWDESYADEHGSASPAAEPEHAGRPGHGEPFEEPDEPPAHGASPAEPREQSVADEHHQETAEHDVEGQLKRDKDDGVLEETPEFLQDTPEHDRLWFEQRPPRDFDFDG
jgi:hypothetical protein